MKPGVTFWLIQRLYGKIPIMSLYTWFGFRRAFTGEKPVLPGFCCPEIFTEKP